MQRGFVNIKNIEDMDNILLEDECYNCGTHLNCTIANCLYQPLSGSDYIIGGTKAAVICLSCGIGNYVTGICIGKPSKYINIEIIFKFFFLILLLF